MSLNASFRARLLSGDRLLGTFVKTPVPAVIEILGQSGLDFLVLDAEHVAMGRETVDLCLLAARAASIPMLVRVPAAGYGRRSVAEHLERAGGETVLVCQIEDPEAARAAGAIARVPGVDCLFVGPVDLAVACGKTSPADSDVVALCRQVLGSADDGGARTGMFVGSAGQIPGWADAGASLFVVATDQAFLKVGAAVALAMPERD